MDQPRGVVAPAWTHASGMAVVAVTDGTSSDLLGASHSESGRAGPKVARQPIRHNARPLASGGQPALAACSDGPSSGDSMPKRSRRHQASGAVHPWTIGCHLRVYRRLSPVGGCGGCRVAVASGHEGTGRRVASAAGQRLVVRQRAGVGGGRVEYGLVCQAGGQGRAARDARLGLWAGVAAHSAVGGAAAVSRDGAWDRCGQRAGVRGPWAAAGGAWGGHPGGGLFGGGLREPVGLAGRPGRRRGRFGGRPAHPGQVPSTDAGKQCAGHWCRVAAGLFRGGPPRLHRPAGADR